MCNIPKMAREIYASLNIPPNRATVYHNGDEYIVPAYREAQTVTVSDIDDARAFARTMYGDDVVITIEDLEDESNV